MSIVTRHGDLGTTRLIHGRAVSKGSARVEAFGTADELGAVLGVARAHAGDDPVAARLEALQRELFVVGAELATLPADRAALSTRLAASHVEALDAQVAELEALPGLLDDWALPGATLVGAQLDVGRTVCRRAERQVVRLVDAGEEDNLDLVAWLNRLADLLWLYARWYELRHHADGALRAAGGQGFSSPLAG